MDVDGRSGSARSATSPATCPWRSRSTTSSTASRSSPATSSAERALEVTYTVKNVTGEPQEVTFDDGQGGTITKTVEEPIPMVGSLTTIAPPNFTDVTSDQANMAGDGKGGTKLSFTMTLFPPIGSDTAEFGYTATSPTAWSRGLDHGAPGQPAGEPELQDRRRELPEGRRHRYRARRRSGPDRRQPPQAA